MNLQTHLNSFVKTTNRLLEEFNINLEAYKLSEAKSFELLPEMAVLRLHDEWAIFCRSIILGSSQQRTMTSSGAIIGKSLNTKTRNDAIQKSIRSTGGRYEPKWATATESIKAARAIGLPNYTTISAALGATNSPAEELRCVRNFFAHRAKNTAIKVSSLAFVTTSTKLSAEGLLTPAVSGGTTRFESWILGLRSIGAAAIM